VKGDVMETFSVRYRVEGDCIVIDLPEEVDNHSSRTIREDTEKLLEEYARRPIRNMVFDFSRTSFCDSSGIGVILGRCKRMRGLGGTVYVSGESRRVERILRMSGVYQVAERAEKIEA
jgi:stage II sporulation protein AA (anti-sigma F factor antagonist)